MFLFCSFSGQICFCLVNLESIPYAVELQEVPKSEMLAAITDMITKALSRSKIKFIAKNLVHLLQAGKASIKIDPSERPYAKALQDILCNTLEYSAYPLRNHKIYLVVKYSIKEFYTKRFLII